MRVVWSREDLFEFLRERRRIGRLATVTPEGRPHVVPVWFTVQGEDLLVHSMALSRKARNIENSGSFSLAVDGDDWPYEGVTISGSAKVARWESDVHGPLVEEMTVGYLGEDHRRMGRAMARMEGEHVMLVLMPEQWAAFDYANPPRRGS